MSRIILCLIMFLCPLAKAEDPLNPNKQWWDEEWWEKGRLTIPVNNTVTIRHTSYTNGDVEIPALIIRPDDNKKYPGILFQHGRRGLDDLVVRHAKRVAARGFVILAPDVFSARFIEKYPIEHDYALESDVNMGVDHLLSLPDISSDKICLYSHTRGGYLTLKVAVTKKRQNKEVACYVSYYPHMQDPNAPEPMQVYRYAKEADDLVIPALIFIGEKEQYQRRRSIETAVKSMQANNRPVELFIYPGVGRGFDFRPENIRTFADDLAAKDAIQRAADFMSHYLQ
ncbi:MAG: dienelactone hydrolase family protein [Candidatus Thiodiazotropha endolucinida]|nr:dienelactone hydrolase family protein [Candidatus Thiodiazotropha sp. (ex Lucina pensylvanica)]MBT3014179.1 dienelactone hydrolase family protein [Candidatus Thiodiazotropha taylori]